MKGASKNSKLSSAINRYSRSQMYARRGFASQAKRSAHTVSAPKKVESTESKSVSKYYPAEDLRTPRKTRKVNRKTRLRESITPGTVLILLAGRFQGKRVVFLRQLDSGLLLVSGPFKSNGVPLKRVNQAYVIATSTKIDISSVKSVDALTDSYFVSTEKAKKASFFDAAEAATSKVTDAQKQTQKQVDSELLKAIKSADPLMESYLKSRFSLQKGQAPHAMKF